MTNEEKAKELAFKSPQCQMYIDNKCNQNFPCDRYNVALEMAEWKDEQFQKVLDYAENCYGVFSFEQRKNFINHIKKIFYGKE